MALRITRTVFAGLVAAALAVTTGALPASAAAAEVFIAAPDVTLPVHGSGILVSPLLAASEPVTVTNSRVTFRLSDFRGAVTLTGDDRGQVHCTSTTPLEVVCVNGGSLDLDPYGIAGLFRVQLKALYSPRAEGSLQMTFSGDGYGPVTQTVRVRAGDPVDLTAGPGQEKTASPGERFYVQLQVKNTGTDGITGAAVVFNSGPDITTRDRPRNCWFSEGRPTACFWDKRLVWDSLYQVNLGLYVSKDAEAPGLTSMQPQWMTAAEFEDYQAYLTRRGLDLGQPGIDLDAKLTRITPPTNAVAAAQADNNPDDNWSYVTVNIKR